MRKASILLTLILLLPLSQGCAKMFGGLRPELNDNAGLQSTSGGVWPERGMLEDSDFQDIYENLMEPDGFEMFKQEFGSNDSLSYEINGSSLLIYFTDKNILEDLQSACKYLGADEITLQDNHIRCWFD